MMTSGEVKSVKLFISERSCLDPHLAFVVMLAIFLWILRFLKPCFIFCQISGLSLFYSVLFSWIQKNLKIKRLINFWCLTTDWHSPREKENTFFPSLKAWNGISESNMPADCFSMVGLALRLSFFHSPFQDFFSKNILWGPNGRQHSVFGWWACTFPNPTLLLKKKYRKYIAINRNGGVLQCSKPLESCQIFSFIPWLKAEQSKPWEGKETQQAAGRLLPNLNPWASLCFYAI